MKSQYELIIEELTTIYKTQNEVDLFLSTPNKLFHYRAPIDCLKAGNYTIFYDLFDRNNKKGV